MAARKTVPVNPEQDAEFDAAFELLTQTVDLEQVDRDYPVRGNTVYITSVILWMLVYQRMCPDSSLEAAVKKLLEVQPTLLPDNKRVTEGTLSSNTSTYSQARSRIAIEAVRQFALQVSQSLINVTEPTFDGRRVFLFDGTTITLAPESVLRQEYPPATNQNGESVFPTALLVVAHEMASGAAMLPEVGAMYGPNAVSETVLMRDALCRLPEGSIVMADSNYGIFAVTHECTVTKHPFLFGISKSRFTSYCGKAELVEQGAGFKTWSFQWRPSRDERKKHIHLPPDAVVNVRLHEIVITKKLTLLFVTDLPHSAKVIAALYNSRYDVEVDIRNFKVVFDAENLRARSVDTFEKELLASVVSYNLVSQFRRQAAKLAGEKPRQMSFKRTWTTFQTFLLSKMFTDPVKWREQYRIALSYAQLDKLPNRPNRSFEREAYKRRRKADSFKTRKRKPPPD